MSRGPQVSVEVHETVQRLVFRGFGKAQIYRELDRVGLIDEGVSPSKSTIDRLVDKLKPEDPSGPWSSAEADSESPGDARLVLDVVASIFHSTDGRVWPSKAHVAEIARLRRAVPDIPWDWAHGLARAFRLCREQGRDSRHLDIALGERPWQDVLGADRIARALGRPRSFRVTGPLGPLYVTDSHELLFALERFQGSIDDMGSRLEAESLSESIPDPPEVILVDGFGEPRVDSSPRRRLGASLLPINFDDLGSSLGIPAREGEAE
jgi:hypothetical protein